MLDNLLSTLTLSRKGFVRVAVGCLIMAFVIVNVHMPSQITEGGVLGLVLFSHKVLGLDPAIMSPIFDLMCYGLGFSLLGAPFLKKAGVASLLFAAFYKLFLWIGPVLPSLYHEPLFAAIIGGLGIGIGCGLVVTVGGAAGGDDALAMVIAKKTKWPISRAYLLTDITVLTLSLSYIAPQRLIFSLITTLVSSFLIGQFEIRLAKPVWDMSVQVQKS